jgi:hypothetical protein
MIDKWIKTREWNDESGKLGGGGSAAAPPLEFGRCQQLETIAPPHVFCVLHRRQSSLCHKLLQMSSSSDFDCCRHLLLLEETEIRVLDGRF